jgi:hypothetical protein
MTMTISILLAFVLIVFTITVAELPYTMEQLIYIGTESNYRVNLETFHNICRYNICSVTKRHRGKSQRTMTATNNSIVQSDSILTNNEYHEEETAQGGVNMNNQTCSTC